MNTAIENLNVWGGQFLSLAGTMFWQSSLLGLVILVLDFGLRRHLRASVRYGLWLVLLVKLVTPPSLALPTSPVWWWHPAVSAPLPAPTVQYPAYEVTYDDVLAPDSLRSLAPQPIPPPPTLTRAAAGLLAVGGVSVGLLLWLLLRWRQVVRTGRAADEAPVFAPLLEETRRLGGISSRVRVKITRDTMSPAVCGLFRPVILLPQSLTEKLSPAQLRAVLLHELMHLRRGDVWVNFAQALLQIVYWWHPLVWLANARIRRLREEAVDDAVVVALREESEIYAPTLLAVAKFAFQRPLASLGLVGILESRSALRQRIERLVNFPAPRQAGLTLLSAFGILAFSAVALPMGEAPEPLPASQTAAADAANLATEQQFHDGKVLYEMGKLDEAEAKFDEELKLQPGSARALYYLDLIKQSKARLAAAHPYVAPLVYTGQGRQVISEKLDSLRLDQVAYTNLPLSEVLRNLSAQVKQLDPDNTGVNFLINPNAEGSQTTRDTATGLPFTTQPAEPADINSTLIKLSLSNVRLRDVLDALVLVADHPIKYSVEDFAVVFFPKATDEGPLFMRTFKIDPDTFEQGLAGVGSKTFGGTGNNNGTEVPAVNIAPAVSQTGPAGPLSGANSGPQRQAANPYLDKLSANEQRNNKINDGFRNLSERLGMDLSPPKAFFYNDRRGLLFVKATKSDLNKIERAIADMMPELPRTNHTSSLTNAGVLTNPNFDAAIHALEQRQGVENLSEPEVTVISGREENRITIPPGGLSFPLVSSTSSAGSGTEILGEPAVTSTSGRQTEMRASTVVDNPVPNLSPAASGNTSPRMSAATFGSATNISERRFQMNPTNFFQNLSNFAATTLIGIKNDGERAALEQAVTEMKNSEKNKSQPNVGMTDFFTKFFELLGVSLHPPETLVFNDRDSMLYINATHADLNRIQKIIVATHAFLPPKQLHIKARFIEVVGEITNIPALTRDVNHQAQTQVNILATGPARQLLHQLETMSGAESMAEPEVTTTSGRQAIMRATVEITVATGFKPSGQNDNPISFITQKVETGPVFDVVPQVDADGVTIDLKINANLSEFEGYDVPTNFVVVHAPPWPQFKPVFSTSRMSAHIKLYDNQSFLLQDLQPRFTDFVKPDSNSKPDPGRPKKRLVVLVAASIVDEAGNRVHADGQPPFAQDLAPPQADPVLMDVDPVY